MKKIFLLLLVLTLLLPGCAKEAQPLEATVLPTTVPETTVSPTTVPETVPMELHPTTEQTLPPIVRELTEEQQQMLLKLGMAELGATECTTCIAMVMNTVLNRVESGRFSKSIKGVIHAQDQFTPVMDGTYDKAVPNEACYAALDMVMRGWDESCGALYYEFCEGESWHSKNLQLVTSHCNTRFYQ